MGLGWVVLLSSYMGFHRGSMEFWIFGFLDLWILDFGFWILDFGFLGFWIFELLDFSWIFPGFPLLFGSFALHPAS